MLNWLHQNRPQYTSTLTWRGRIFRSCRVCRRGLGENAGVPASEVVAAVRMQSQPTYLYLRAPYRSSPRPRKDDVSRLQQQVAPIGDIKPSPLRDGLGPLSRFPTALA